MPARAQKLRVYVTQIGLTRWAVAAPSQKAALAAWDVRENLFATGAAATTTDPEAVELAMKTPGQPVALDERKAELGRIIRLDDHRPKPAAAKAIAKTPAPAKPQPKARPEPKLPSPRAKLKPKPKPKPDRTALTAAERALGDFHRRAIRERSALRRAWEELETRADAIETQLEREERKLKADVERERRKLDALRSDD